MSLLSNYELSREHLLHTAIENCSVIQLIHLIVGSADPQFLLKAKQAFHKIQQAQPELAAQTLQNESITLPAGAIWNYNQQLTVDQKIKNSFDFLLNKTSKLDVDLLLNPSIQAVEVIPLATVTKSNSASVDSNEDGRIDSMVSSAKSMDRPAVVKNTNFKQISVAELAAKASSSFSSFFSSETEADKTTTNSSNLLNQIEVVTVDPSFMELDSGAKATSLEAETLKQDVDSDKIKVTVNEEPAFAIPVLNTEYKRHRLLNLLLSDFFEPWTVKKLFTTLFPKHKYTPASAKNLLHQSIFELRKEIQEQQWPFVIVWRHEKIWIEFLTSVVFTPQFIQYKISLDSVPSQVSSIAEFRKNQLLEKLRQEFGANEFSILEVQDKLQMARRTAQRHLQSLTLEGQLNRIGQKFDAKYKVPTLN